jgi:heme/copper-type cytochrome/quinol oxidase subunit 1
MPRRYADYPARFTALNLVSSIGALILAVSTLPFLWNIYITARHGDLHYPLRPEDSGEPVKEQGST